MLPAGDLHSAGALGLCQGRDPGGRRDSPAPVLIRSLWSCTGPAMAGQPRMRSSNEPWRDSKRPNPGIRVTRLNPGDAGSFYTKLQTMMAAGTPPDVFYVGAERLASYADAGLLLPLDDWVGVEGTAGDFQLDAFYPATVDAFRFEDGRVGQGRLWGIPKDFTTVGFYYNRDLLERAGMPEPASDWTWDEFIESARAVGQLPECTGAEFVNWPSMIRAVLWTENVDLLDDDTSIRFDDPKVVEVLERIRSWRHDETNTLTSGRSETANPASDSSAASSGSLVRSVAGWCRPIEPSRISNGIMRRCPEVKPPRT